MKPKANGLRVRENMVALAAWDPTFIWYSKGVGAMRKRALNDPRSWRYQAAIHDYIRAADPLRQPSDVMPSPADQRKFWAQCQHGSWFFLPWHRAYLAFFEQMLVAEIVALGGPDEWALPYWNYSDGAASALVRQEFLAAKLPDGSKNELSAASRNPVGPNGDIGITTFDVDLDCLNDAPFTNTPGATGFGGPKTGFQHRPAGFGSLESVPHNSVHGAVGGWMGGFNTAGLDPLFWTHHANIDRLWAVWRARDPANIDPTDPTWVSAAGVTFNLHDATGTARTFTSQDVVDTTAALMGYTYDDLSDPFSGAGLASAGGSGVAQAPPSVSLVGAAPGPTLSAEAASARVAVDPAAAAGAALSGEPQRTYLNLENITGADNSATYKVFVTAGDSAALDEGEYAGLLPMFGLAEASDGDAQHGASGLTHVLDITEIVEQIRAAGGNPNDLRVTFVPLRKQEPGAIKVGRISLYAG